MFTDYPALLVTKLYVPRLRAAHVARPVLLHALETGMERKLMLVAAGAGFGKTTLVAEWCIQHLDAVCWLSLDAGDNDPTRFLSYLVAALQSRHSHVGRELLAMLQSPQPPTLTNATHSLINHIASLNQRLILVLDDYHVINQPAIHEALTLLLDYLPPQMTVVLITRSDPPLPLAKLRAKGDLYELRAPALQFSVEDAHHFLRQMLRFDLAPTAVETLINRTEGWITGLQLAAVTLQSLPAAADQQTFVESFAGDNRYILDYLLEEVLAHQPEIVRRFMLETAFLQRLNAGLCAAVTGMSSSESQAMLDTLERNNLFVTPLDSARRWYRYHPLFAELLQTRLLTVEDGANRLKVLQRRAAEVCAAEGWLAEAVDYTLAAEDYDYAAQLIIQPDAQFMWRSEIMTLLNWYHIFPTAVIQRYPRLSLQFGMAFALNGRWEEAETLLGYLEVSSLESHPEEALLLAFLVAGYRQDTAKLTHIIAIAESQPTPSAVTYLIWGLVVSSSGDFRRACDLMAAAQSTAEHAGDQFGALTALFHRCRLHTFAGDLHEAYDLSQQALSYIQTIGARVLPLASLAHVSLGRILIEWNDLDSAEQHLNEAVRLSNLSGIVAGMISSATLMLAEVQQARGDVTQAAQTAQLAIHHAEHNDPPSEVEWLKVYQVRVWVTQGNMAAVGDWLKQTAKLRLPPSSFYPSRIRRVTQARVLFAQRKFDDAISLLTQLLTEPHDLLTVEILVMLALCRQMQGDSVHALLAIEQALTLGSSERRIRALLDFGVTVAKLITRFCEANPTHQASLFARDVLALLPTDITPPLIALNERELTILRLIAAGLSNDEIANQLTLALSTVKWYINELYSKLQVKTRGQAIARAYDLRLVE